MFNKIVTQWTRCRRRHSLDGNQIAVAWSRLGLGMSSLVCVS